ncbi:hypothetical protein D3C76_382470 [compost metagenome]
MIQEPDKNNHYMGIDMDFTRSYGYLMLFNRILGYGLQVFSYGIKKLLLFDNVGRTESGRMLNVTAANIRPITPIG